MIFNLTKEDLRDIRNTTFATVIATIIIGFSKYLFDNGAKSLNQDFLVNFVKWLAKPTLIVNWLFLLAVVFILFSVIQMVKKYFRPRVIPNKMQFQVKATLDIPKRLEKIEEDILMFLSKTEDLQIVGVHRKMISSQFKEVSETKLNYYLNQLVNKMYVSQNGYDGRLYLQDKSREYLIKNELI